MRSTAERRRYLEGELMPALGSYKAKVVTRRNVRDLVGAKQANAPVAARNLLAYVRAMFNWALERDLVETNPCAGIKLATARKRSRVLNDEEIRAFWTGLDDAEIRPLMRAALTLILVTGQRPGEVIGMTWDDIHGEVWVIPEHRHKTEDGQRVPLTPLALELVEAVRNEQTRLAKRRGSASEHLFTKGVTPYTVNALSRAVKRNAQILGNKYREPWGHWTPHDLRRTVRTGLSALKIPEHIAERVIGHRPQGVVAVYDQHRYEPEKRAALEAWEQRLRRIVGDSATDNVTSISTGK
jgi:integrase